METCQTLLPDGRPCGKKAKHTSEGRSLCGNHARYLRESVAWLQRDAEAMILTLTDRYLPEMRRQDAGMLARIATRPIEEDERIEMRLHLAARRLAAQRALEEKALDGAVIVA